MDLLGIRYETCPAAFDEKSVRDPDPVTLTKKLAEAKAWKVADGFSDAIVVAGDAVVAKEKTIFEKPHNIEEAVEFLLELSGSTFRFVTSLVVLRTDTRKMLSVDRRNFGNQVSPAGGSRNRDYVRRHPVLQFAGAFDGDGVLRFA
jgi:predicted house-cleaning NTP pyrophosphatase (Maf/HAM1 superfamily)